MQNKPHPEKHEVSPSLWSTNLQHKAKFDSADYFSSVEKMRIEQAKAFKHDENQEMHDEEEHKDWDTPH